MEPPHVPIEGISVDRVLSRSVGMELNKQGVEFSHNLNANKQLSGTQGFSYPFDSLMLLVAKFSDKKLTLPKGTTLGLAQEISENIVVSVTHEGTDECVEQTFFVGVTEVPKNFKKYIDEKLAHLSHTDRKTKTGSN